MGGGLILIKFLKILIEGVHRCHALWSFGNSSPAVGPEEKKRSGKYSYFRYDRKIIQIKFWKIRKVSPGNPFTRQRNASPLLLPYTTPALSDPRSFVALHKPRRNGWRGRDSLWTQLVVFSCSYLAVHRCTRFAYLLFIIIIHISVIYDLYTYNLYL